MLIVLNSNGRSRRKILKISEIEELSLNPFWLSKLISHFNEGYGGNAPFELVYLLFPLVLRERTRNKLSTLNRSSNIYSALLDDKEKRILISALQFYVEEYKQYVKPSLIVYANFGNEFGLKLKNNSAYDFKKEKDSKTKNYYKAAYYLGVIFSKEKSSECFYKLGVFKV
jgi:hypothetical protein